MSIRIAAIISAEAETALSFSAAEDWLLEQAAPLATRCRPELTGLYLASRDAGNQASIQFWADGIRAGLAFANPRDFHRTLANSPASHLAIRYVLQGPGYTLIGEEEATLAALEHAQADLLAGLIESALVVRFDMSPVTSVTGITLTTLQDSEK